MIRFFLALILVGVPAQAAVYGPASWYDTLSALTNAQPLVRNPVAGVVLSGTNRLYSWSASHTNAVSGYDVLPSVAGGRWVSFIPASGGSGTVTSVGLTNGVSGLGIVGSTITSSGTFGLTGTVAVASGGTGAGTAAAGRAALGADVLLGGATIGNPNLSGTAAITKGGRVTPEAQASTNVVYRYIVREPIGPGDWYTPASNYAFFNTTNSSPVGIFDPDTTKALQFNRTLPMTLEAVPSQLTVVTHWRPVTGNSASQTIIVGVKVQAIADSDSWNTVNLVTNTVSSQTWIHSTNTVTALSGLALGSEFQVQVYADSAGTATNLYQMSLSGSIRYE